MVMSPKLGQSLSPLVRRMTSSSSLQCNCRAVRRPFSMLTTSMTSLSVASSPSSPPAVVVRPPLSSNCWQTVPSLHHHRHRHHHHGQASSWGVQMRRSFWSLPRQMRRSGECLIKKGKVSPMLKVPPHILRPSYASNGVPKDLSQVIHIHTKETIPYMRAANQLARRMLDFACSLAEPGITTDEIDRQVHEAIIAAGAYPSPLNYRYFPKSICTSINEVACHGIPDDRPLQDGDIVSFDVSLYLKGFHGDNCTTVPIGDVNEGGLNVIACARAALDAALQVCKPGAPVSAIGNTIHDFTDLHGYSTVREFCGHGLGREFHMNPFIQHCRNSDSFRMVPGMAFTIEPVISEGHHKVETWDDGWTVIMADGSRAAQFEHAILITEDGYEVLTVPYGGAPPAQNQDENMNERNKKPTTTAAAVDNATAADLARDDSNSRKGDSKAAVKAS